MSHPFRLIPEAECEYRAAIRWYDRTRRGRGNQFSSAVKKELRRIVALPERWPLEIRDIRRAILGAWPYSIFYRVRPSSVRIISIFHHSRDPQEWMDRT